MDQLTGPITNLIPRVRLVFERSFAANLPVSESRRRSRKSGRVHFRGSLETVAKRTFCYAVPTES